MRKAMVKQDMLYPHPVQRVWVALTDHASLAQWLLPNDFEPRVGHHFTFRGEPQDGWSGVVECEVVEIVPLHRLAFTWSAHPRFPDMLVSFTLKEVEDGTHLCLEQREFRCSKPLTRGERSELPSLQLLLGDELPSVSRFFRIQVDETALTDALFEFVADPSASRNNRPVMDEMHAFAPEMVSVLENMVLDGVSERHYVADYIHFVFGRLSA